MDDNDLKLKRKLWEVFARTGSIIDYITYANALKRTDDSVRNWDQSRIP